TRRARPHRSAIMKNVSSIFYVIPLGLLFASCQIVDVSDEFHLKKGSVITLQEPYYLLEYPGTDKIITVKDYTKEPYYAQSSKSKTLLPAGTQIRYLKTVKEDAMMAPKPSSASYGKLIRGMHYGRFGIKSLLRNQYEGYDEAFDY
ncbi:MAG: hypothetical protein ABGY95_12160, partial [Rubritalea sp.]|uniref:hypothetical protein n=1 Tax=Rubritalea sp. TaxID=2109375 RepID=UPI0032424B42